MTVRNNHGIDVGHWYETDRVHTIQASMKDFSKTVEHCLRSVNCLAISGGSWHTLASLAEDSSSSSIFYSGLAVWWMFLVATAILLSTRIHWTLCQTISYTVSSHSLSVLFLNMHAVKVFQFSPYYIIYGCAGKTIYCLCVGVHAEKPIQDIEVVYTLEFKLVTRT